MVLISLLVCGIYIILAPITIPTTILVIINNGMEYLESLPNHPKQLHKKLYYFTYKKQIEQSNFIIKPDYELYKSELYKTKSLKEKLDILTIITRYEYYTIYDDQRYIIYNNIFFIVENLTKYEDIILFCNFIQSLDIHIVNYKLLLNFIYSIDNYKLNKYLLHVITYLITDIADLKNIKMNEMMIYKHFIRFNYEISKNRLLWMKAVYRAVFKN